MAILFTLLCIDVETCQLFADDAKQTLTITWDKGFLTVHGDHVPGSDVRINYLEAYCRPGSTDRDWQKTVIKHQSELIDGADSQHIGLVDRLEDGVIVTHKIEAHDDEVDFQLEAENPTKVASQADWAQPCVRLDKFTGKGSQDYVPLCFIFVDGKLTRLPTEPWAKVARYVPGQVYCPKGVDRNDVNPRPLSEIVPSNGLCGCYSGDGKWILATAWEPYQELFQGVATCMHSDFRLGGLAAGEKKKIRGKLYIVPAREVKMLVQRYERDFPEHLEK